MSGRLNHRVREALTALHQRDRHRRRRVIEPVGPGLSRVDGQVCVNFCSNDYLGLAQDPRLQATCGAAGSGASALVTGYSPAHAELEAALANWLGRDRVLLFPSGFSANVGCLDALLRRGDQAVCDALNHASLIDGVRLSGATKAIYPHADVQGAEAQLKTAPEAVSALVTDSVFSMDGDVAPLEALATLARTRDALLYVDDAHGLGVLGDDGAGVAAQHGQDSIPMLIGTLGKSLGAAGAFVAGPAELIDYLENRARTQIYSTACPPVAAQAALSALHIARVEPWRRERIRELITHLHQSLAAAGLPVPQSQTAIQPIVLGTDASALRTSQNLQARGYLVTAIRPPTVPEGSARLRITLTAAHSKSQVSGLVEALADSLLESRVA